MQQIVIRDTISAEDITTIIARHRIVYENEYSFDESFGDYVAETLAEKFEHLWIADRDGKFLGCIGMVETNKQTAQLRWLLIEPEVRGRGVGKALMQEFLDYCKIKKYANIFLWTVNKLVAARIVYERLGFQLTEQKPEKLLWGQLLIEQRWDLSLEMYR